MELEFIGLELEVGPRFGSYFDEGRQVALEAGQLQVRNFQNVVAHVVEETCADRRRHETAAARSRDA